MALSAVMRTLVRSDMVKRELNRKAFTGRSTFQPSPVVMTERARAQIQAAEMGFFLQVAEVILRGERRSSIVYRQLGAAAPH